MKTIKFSQVRSRIAVARAWNRRGPLPDGIPRPWDSVRGRIIRALADFQRRKILRIREVFGTRGDDPA